MDKQLIEQCAIAAQPPAPSAPLDESRYCPDCEALQAKVAELEADNRAAWATADRHMTERNEARERIAEQAALIEKCEKALKKHGAAYLGHQEEYDEALAAIAAQKGGAV